jgi:[ribosomal protein S18]-alanine N-acetyltransferase
VPEPALSAFVFSRASTEADLDQVASLEARCFHNPWTRDMLGRELARSLVAHVFVLRPPGRPVVAFCSCWIVAEELHINTVAVDEAYRRTGVGTRLMREVLREAARRGATRATLEVRASNVAARRLYETLGFTVTAVRPAYYTHPDEDALILWREDLPADGGAPAGRPPTRRERQS